ncbi:16149_t:CDS:1 [Racocetra persica]|uniref:16149_t:CDS:1 n=1 Tax=Racocetra persica TaxID=160502 RepID=A0ACA9Q0F9_9GLOM|nr:16149_t:CDS:1 [Racocetra persica]
MAKKRKRRKNKFKPILENQIIRINLDYTDEEKDIDLRGNRYYLVTSFKKVKKGKLVIELFTITTKKKNNFRGDKRLILQYKLKKPNCLSNPSLINQEILITLRLEQNKYRHHLCPSCQNICLDPEEYGQIVKEHKEH